MSQITNENLIFISDVKGKKFIYFGIIAKMMWSLFFIKDDWLKSIKIKRQIFTFENLKIIFIEIESENDLSLK
jgi:hypothetical protein